MKENIQKIVYKYIQIRITVHFFSIYIFYLQKKKKTNKINETEKIHFLLSCKLLCIYIQKNLNKFFLFAYFVKKPLDGICILKY